MIWLGSTRQSIFHKVLMLDYAFAGRQNSVRVAEGQRLQLPDPASGRVTGEVFLSYARKDAKWRNDLVTILAPAIRGKALDLWYDEKIKPGRDWRKEIQDAMNRCRVGVLLVSKHFLASEFITNDELPFMIQAAKRAGVKLTWLLISEALYEDQEFKSLQALHDVSRLLLSLKSAVRDKVMKEIAQKIVELAR